MRAHGEIAAAAHRGEKRTLRRDARVGLRVIQRGADGFDPRIILTNLNADGRLSDAGQHLAERERRGRKPRRNVRPHEPSIRGDVHLKTAQPGRGENRGVEVGLLGDLPQPRPDIAANLDDAQVRPMLANLRRAPRAAGRDDCAVRQPREVERGTIAAPPRVYRSTEIGSRHDVLNVAIDQHVADILARRHRTELQARRKLRW